MKVIIIHSSPNPDGLTAACAAASQEGISRAGHEAQVLMLNRMNIGLCQACNDGWGTCRTLHTCQVEDGFQTLHRQTLQADALVLVTPVYWGEMSESAKAFTDRLRRCEATLGKESRMVGKPILFVAAAGGSGNGTITCLLNMERWAQHIQARVFDLITVNRWSRDYKLQTIRAAAHAMVTRGFPD